MEVWPKLNDWALVTSPWLWTLPAVRQKYMHYSLTWKEQQIQTAVSTQSQMLTLPLLWKMEHWESFEFNVDYLRNWGSAWKLLRSICSPRLSSPGKFMTTSALHWKEPKFNSYKSLIFQVIKFNSNQDTLYINISLLCLQLITDPDDQTKEGRQAVSSVD